MVLNGAEVFPFGSGNRNNEATGTCRAESSGTSRRPERTDSKDSAASRGAEENALVIATAFHQLIEHNPHSKPERIPRAWQHLWTDDFRHLLDIYTEEEVPESTS